MLDELAPVSSVGRSKPRHISGRIELKSALPCANITVLDTLWSGFGEDQLIFGSNWPVSGGRAPLATVVGIVHDYFTANGDLAAAKFFHSNSQSAYAWRMR